MNPVCKPNYHSSFDGVSIASMRVESAMACSQPYSAASFASSHLLEFSRELLFPPCSVVSHCSPLVLCPYVRISPSDPTLSPHVRLQRSPPALTRQVSPTFLPLPSDPNRSSHLSPHLRSRAVLGPLIRPLDHVAAAG